jgi:pYEATS domain-containing protein involved in immunity
LQNFSNNIKALNEKIENVSMKILSIESSQKGKLPPELLPLTDEEKNSILVKQVPRRIGEELVELTFSIDVEVNGRFNRDSAMNIMNKIDKVVYHLDERWFKAPSVVQVNKLENFKMGIRVWGRTKVKVEIYVNGEESPIIREGFMNLNDTTFFKKS